MDVPQYKVLVVEDDEEVRSILIETIGRIGLQADEAKDGKEALEKLDKNQYDVVLCDIKMPNLDGFEFSEQIYNCGRNIPIVILTANSDRDGVRRLLKAGVVDFLEKPCEEQDLEKALHRAIDEGLRRSGKLPWNSRHW